MIGWKQRPWLCLDTETTGITEAHIVQLGACEYRRGAVSWKHSRLFKPPIPIPPEASEVHGITDLLVVGAPDIQSAREKILSTVSKYSVIVGYNLQYDLDVLQRELGVPVTSMCDAHICVDPLIVIRMDHVGRYWKGQGRHRLAHVCETLGIPLNAHSAVDDAVAAGAILWRLINHLPDDDRECYEFLREQKKRQDDNYAAWKARQVP